MKETVNNTKKKKSRALVPALCNIVGILIILSVILLCLPMTVPRLFGCGVYEVLTPSMSPKIPAGSLVISKPVVPETVEVEDVIVFAKGGGVVTHRVVENQKTVGRFITKGDANDTNDIDPVPYGALVGKVVFHMPLAGTFMSALASTAGKIYLLIFTCCGFMFRMLGSMLEDLSSKEGNS